MLIYGIIALIFAALLSFVFTPVVRVIAFKIGAIDIPRDDRRMHKKPIPRLGGLAIFLSFCITSLIFCDYSASLLVMWFGGMIIMATGILDDVFSIHPLVKLAVQIIVAVLAVSQGIVIEFINVFGYYITFGIFSVPVTIAWIVLLTNAINIIDGLDGLACGVSAICSTSFLLVSLVVAEPSYALVAAVITGCCLGFLPFNSNPAKIFMGDTGSLFLGYILAIISVQGLFKFHAVMSFLIPISIFAVPIFDIVFAFIRRLIRGKNPFSADRGHIHHRLIEMGFNQKQSVYILYSVCGILGVSAVMVAFGKFISAAFVIIIGFIAFTVNYLIIKNPKLKNLLGFDFITVKPAETKKADPEDTDKPNNS